MITHSKTRIPSQHSTACNRAFDELLEAFNALTTTWDNGEKTLDRELSYHAVRYDIAHWRECTNHGEVKEPKE